MRKKMLATLLTAMLLSAVFLFSAESGAETVPERKLTIMVYMCGSNLESTAGSATADIQEMLSARFDTTQVSLLVMIGGTKAWDLGYDPGQTQILEIRKGRARSVWQAEKMNMGSGDTLKQLLNFAVEHYQAKDYALILWDHGGGPLEGVCWDELHGMDCLTLAEITKALRKSRLTRLSWIGFDACLMSSLEVASTLAPYAKYMIASQETEPATGWNYSFLNGIEADENGKETGGRIIDAYFEGQEQYHDILTLSCTDLEKVSEAAAALGRAVQPMTGKLDAEEYLKLSSARKESTAFGKASPIQGSDGYDLVDAVDFLRQLEVEDAQFALKRLEDAVCYARSNEAGANGLTLYHPYSNKNKYQSRWKDSYINLNFNTAYTKYIDAFGAMLTGRELTEWNDLITRNDGEDGAGNDLFSVQLTEDQVNGFASAQLLVLGNGALLNRIEGEDSVLLATETAELDENGCLRAAYDGRLLYIETDKDMKGPLSFTQTENGAFNVIYTEYMEDGLLDSERLLSVLYYLETGSKDEYPQIARTQVYDEATGEYTNRLAFSEDDYPKMLIPYLNRMTPDIAASGVLPAFMDWPYNSNVLSGEIIQVQSGWRIHLFDSHYTGRQLYAMFQITDLQQNTYCSIPIPIENQNLTEWITAPEFEEGEQNQVQLAGRINSAMLDSGIELDITVRNDTEEDREYTVRNLLLNGCRWADINLREKIAAHDQAVLSTISVNLDDLIGLTEITSAEISLESKLPDRPESQETNVYRFRISNADLQGVVPASPQPMAEIEQGGMTVQLLELKACEQDRGITAKYLIRNNREGKVSVSACMLNDVWSGDFVRGDIAPGTERIIRGRILNDLQCDSFFVQPEEQAIVYDTLMLDRIQQIHGHETVESVSLYFRKEDGDTEDKEEIRLNLTAPWPIQEGTTSGENLFSGLSAFHTAPEHILQAEDQQAVLLKNNQMEIRLKNLAVGEHCTAMSLDILNKTDDYMEIKAGNVRINGQPLSSWKDAVFAYSSNYLKPHSIGMAVLTSDWGEEYPDILQIEEIEILLTASETDPEEAHPVVIRMNTPAISGRKEGEWRLPDDLEITAGYIPDEIPEEDEDVEPLAFETEILMPEAAEQYGFSVPIPLNASQLEQAKQVHMLLIRTYDETTLQLLTIQTMNMEKGKDPTFWCPGLIACIQDHPEAYWQMTLLARPDSLKGMMNSPVRISNDLLSKRCLLKKMEYIWQKGNAAAVIHQFQQEGDTFERQKDMQFAAVYPVLLECDPENLIFFKDMKVRFSFEDMLNSPTIKLKNKPLQAVLRPVEPDDRVMVFWNIVNQDGSSYVLPLVPYEAILPDRT